MIRRSLPWMIVGVAALMVVTLNAGGWAVVTLDTLPDAFVVGKATPVAFMVRQHGVSPMESLRPTVQAVSGRVEVTAKAEPTGRTGHYSASLALPHAGEWVITVHTSFMDSRLTLLPLKAIASSATVASLSDVERGRGLFTAKGCVTCHTSNFQSANRSLNVGPPIVPQKYPAEFLTRILTDPASALPPRDPMARMPNLDLKPQEIASLVAFINTVPTTATR